MLRKSAVAFLTVGVLLAVAVPAVAKDPKVGKKQEIENGTITVLTYEQPAAVPLDSYGEPEPGEELAAIQVKVCNTSDRAQIASPGQFELQLGNQTRVDSTYGGREPELDAGSGIDEGECVRGWVTFSVPDDEKVKGVRFSGGGLFVEEQTIRRWRVTRDTTVSTTTTLPPTFITKAEFDQIQPGMTLDQVNALVGAAGVLQYESGGGTDYSFASYEWTGARSASASVSFQNGVVSSKNQYGLE